MHHAMKVHEQPYADLKSGAKTSEIRKDDRGFQVGDTVELHEHDTIDFTGHVLHRTISHIQRGYGLPDGLCVLSYAQPELVELHAEVQRLKNPQANAEAVAADSVEAVGLQRLLFRHFRGRRPIDVGLMGWAHAVISASLSQADGPNYKFKFETLVEHCKRQDQVISELRYDENIRCFYDEGAAWFWCGDETDNLETLACPVVINAGDLRAMLAKAGRAPEGFALVPLEPTPKMIDATWNDPVDRDGGIESQNTRNERIYKAMVAAARAKDGQ